MDLRVSRAVLHCGKATAWLLIKKGLVVILAITVSCSQKDTELPYYHTADFTPLWMSEWSLSEDTIHTIAPFRFTDQEGNMVTNETFENKIYVANFFFTVCPSICPKLTANLGKVAEAFSDNSDVLFISHSVTPDIDSVAALKEYAARNKIESQQWHLITGEKEAIYSLARQSYFAEQEIGFQYSTQEFLHTEHFILVDRQGHIRGIYKGTLELEAERLIHDIKLLLD